MTHTPFNTEGNPPGLKITRTLNFISSATSMFPGGGHIIEVIHLMEEDRGGKDAEEVTINTFALSVANNIFNNQLLHF